MVKSTSFMLAASVALTGFSTLPAHADPKFHRCPPGLEKRATLPNGLLKNGKGQGCMPPGWVRKFEIGAPIPSGVSYDLITDLALYGLTPPDGNWLYYLVDNEVLRVADATFTILEALGWIEN